MTLLKNLMNERADALEAPVLDLDAITAAGDRRVTRRRGFAGLAAAAVVAGVAIPVGIGLGGDDRAQEDPPVTISESAPLTYATGSVIHAGGTSVDVGHEIHLFVTVDDGYVYATADKKVWHWDGASNEQVGQIAGDYGRQIVADGRWASWMEQDASGVRYATLDTTGDTVGHSPAEYDTRGTDEHFGFELEAQDGPTLYALEGRGAVAVDTTTGQATVLRELDPSSSLSIDDVEDGRILFTGGNPETPEDDADENEKTYLTEDLRHPGTPLPIGNRGDISPDGRYVMAENSATSSDDFTLIEVASGEDLTPGWEKDYGFFTGFAWIDTDSYTAFGMPKDAFGSDDNAKPEFRFHLLVCNVDDGCTKEAEVDWPAQFPIGEHIGD